MVDQARLTHKPALKRTRPLSIAPYSCKERLCVHSLTDETPYCMPDRFSAFRVSDSAFGRGYAREKGYAPSTSGLDFPPNA